MIQVNKCYFCGKECGETVLTVSDKTRFQSELFRANMCAECSEAVHSALIMYLDFCPRSMKDCKGDCYKCRQEWLNEEVQKR